MIDFHLFISLYSYYGYSMKQNVAVPKHGHVVAAPCDITNQHGGDSSLGSFPFPELPKRQLWVMIMDSDRPTKVWQCYSRRFNHVIIFICNVILQLLNQ